MVYPLGQAHMAARSSSKTDAGIGKLYDVSITLMLDRTRGIGPVNVA